MMDHCVQMAKGITSYSNFQNIKNASYTVVWCSCHHLGRGFRNEAHEHWSICSVTVIVYYVVPALENVSGLLNGHTINQKSWCGK
jgi:hypothetical protein